MMKLIEFPTRFWQSLLDYGGLSYTWGTILSLFFINVYFTCPVLEGEQCPYYIAVGIFFLAQVTINFACFRYYARLNRVDVIFPASALPAATVSPNGTMQIRGDPNTTKFCFNCRRSVPIRSHHCPLCNYCVLKKDHHCFLTGACVGFGNQRYFVVFLFWCGIGALYGSAITGLYMNAYIKPFFPYGWLDYIFPVAVKRWILFQHCHVIDLAYAMLFSAGFGGGLCALIFFTLQMQLIVKGQTMYEMHKNDTTAVHPQRTPISLRMRCVFGPYWYGNFLVPLPFKNRLDDAFRKLLYEAHLKEM